MEINGRALSYLAALTPAKETW